MTITTNFGMTLLEASQAQKEITINQSLTTLDAILMGSVIDKDLVAPPVTPVTNAMYIVAASPTGAWAGQAKSLAYYNQIWNFIVPQAGMRVWVSDESNYYQFNGTNWTAAAGASGDMLHAVYDAANISQQMLGTTATQTVTNKTINGASNTLTVRLANDVSGTLPVANGGNGQTSFTDGQLLIGNSTGNTLNKATLTAGTGISITNGSGAITIAATGGGGGSSAGSQPCTGRLTLTSGTPVTSSDVTAATTLYFTPFRGNILALYDGTSTWTQFNFSQLSIAVPATASTLYDVFVYNNSGTPTLELLAWTNDTTRATALAMQDGVYVKSGATTRRYLGSMRTTATSGRTEDSQAKRYVWNNNHRVARPLKISDSTSSWNYSSNTIRQANGNAANQLDMVLGLVEDAVSVNSYTLVSTDTTMGISGGLGIDSTTAFARYGYISLTATQASPLLTSYSGFPGLGRHIFTWLEQGGTTGTQTWYGNASPTGLSGIVWG